MRCRWEVAFFRASYSVILVFFFYIFWTTHDSVRPEGSRVESLFLPLSPLFPGGYEWREVEEEEEEEEEEGKDHKIYRMLLFLSLRFLPPSFLRAPPSRP